MRDSSFRSNEPHVEAYYLKYAHSRRFWRAFGTDDRTLEPRRIPSPLNRLQTSRKDFVMNSFPTRRTIISGASLAGASLAGAA